MNAFLNLKIYNTQGDRKLIEKLKKMDNLKEKYLEAVDKETLDNLIEILQSDPLMNVKYPND